MSTHFLTSRGKILERVKSKPHDSSIHQDCKISAVIFSGVPEQGNPGQNGFGELAQGYLEMSNVKVVEEMVNLIKAQRAYEVNSKAIQAADEMMQRSNNIKR